MMPSMANCFRVSKGENEGAKIDGCPLQITYQKDNAVAAACKIDLLNNEDPKLHFHYNRKGANKSKGLSFKKYVYTKSRASYSTIE